MLALLAPKDARYVGPMRSAPSIRRALPSEAGALTELALRSKAHWGYDAAFMQMARPYMVIAPETVEHGTSFLAESEGEILGFYILAIEDGTPTLRDLWIDPAVLRTGIGSALWAHMIGQAITLSYRTVRIVSEPKAEGFYLRVGARRTGLHESEAVPGRMLPVMEFEPDQERPEVEF
jgi:GNAT superfamily N-acetyltransferase